MRVVYAKENIPYSINKSIFLAGPTPRSSSAVSWRTYAIKILKDAGYDGVVFTPEPRNGIWKDGYEDQVEWEEKCLNITDCILFWIPRNMETLPGFTTNIEWGVWENSGKVVLGVPDSAEKVSYILYYANKLHIPTAKTLDSTVKNALTMVRNEAMRYGGEKEVPLYIWQTPHFQQWYSAHKKAGNCIDGARVEWVFRIGRKKEIVLFWALHVNMYIAAENRNKTNEVVIARPDISTVCMYYPRENIEDTDIILVKEFRSAGSTSDGFVWELPGGFSSRSPNPLATAIEECEEETGLKIDASRMQAHGARQLAATFSAHKAHLFSVEITEGELQYMLSQKGIAHGATDYSERTYVKVVKLKDILDDNKVDWSMLGMITSSLLR